MTLSTRNSRVFYLSQFFHSLIFTIPIWIVYYQSRISVSQISFLVTLQFATQTILELPSGALADLIGRKKTVAIAYFTAFMSFALFPSATTILHFTVLAFLVGLADSFISGSMEALLYDSYLQEKKEEKFASTYANGILIYQIGLVIGPALGGLMYQLYFGFPYYAYSLSLFFGFITTLFFLEPKIDSMKFSLKNYKKQIINGSREAFKTVYSKNFSLFYVAVGAIGWSSTLYFNEYMLIGLGFGDVTRGYISATIRLINTLLIVNLLKRSKFFHKPKTVYLFFPILMLASYLPGPLVNGYWGVPFVQGAMIATTARWVILAPLTNRYFSSENRATAISLLSLLIGLGYVTLTTLSSVIIPTYGIKVMYSLLGLATLLTVVPISSKLINLARANRN